MKTVSYLQIFVVVLGLAGVSSGRRFRCYSNCGEKMGVVKCTGSCFYSTCLMRTVRGCVATRHLPGIFMDGYTTTLFCNKDYCNTGL